MTLPESLDRQLKQIIENCEYFAKQMILDDVSKTARTASSLCYLCKGSGLDHHLAYKGDPCFPCDGTGWNFL